MAVVAKYQTYPSASYNWLSPTDACKDMVDEFKAWLALVNANPGQSGQVCSVLKDETSSTSANYYGMAFEMKDPDGSSLYGRLHTNGESTMMFEVGDTYNDDGTGYGDITGYTIVDNNISFRTSGYDFRSFIAYNTVDGEEWFIFGWGADSTSYADLFFVGKTTEGRWASGASDGNTTLTAISSVAGGHVKVMSFGATTTTVVMPTPGIFLHNRPTFDGSGSNVDLVALKSPDLWYGRYETFGDWVTIDASNNDYLLYVTGQIGIWVRTN